MKFIYRRKYAIIATLLTLWCLITMYNTTQAPSVTDENIVTPFNMSELAKNDFHHLIDTDGFEFTLNTRRCNDSESIPLLIMIHTAPNHTDRREVIRQTWAKQSDSIRLVFLLGGVDTEEVQDDLYFENERYQDIVQGNFYDTYRNLTYKYAMGLKWAVYYCPNAKHILKSDDDTFVNTPYLLQYLSGIDSRGGNSNKTISCLVCRRCAVIRNENSKWYVAKEEYSEEFYPTHCTGFAVLYNPNVAFKLYKQVQASSYFWIDDVYITGIIAQKARLNHRNLNRFMLSPEKMESYTSNYTTYQPFIFGPIQLTIDWMEQLWDLVEYVYKLED